MCQAKSSSEPSYFMFFSRNWWIGPEFSVLRAAEFITVQVALHEAPDRHKPPFYITVRCSLLSFCRAHLFCIFTLLKVFSHAKNPLTNVASLVLMHYFLIKNASDLLKSMEILLYFFKIYSLKKTL